MGYHVILRGINVIVGIPRDFPGEGTTFLSRTRAGPQSRHYSGARGLLSQRPPQGHPGGGAGLIPTGSILSL